MAHGWKRETRVVLDKSRRNEAGLEIKAETGSGVYEGNAEIAVETMGVVGATTSRGVGGESKPLAQ